MTIRERYKERNETHYYLNMEPYKPEASWDDIGTLLGLVDQAAEIISRLQKKQMIRADDVDAFILQYELEVLDVVPQTSQNDGPS